jgi:multiple sugar transport system ATP-binding protein
MGHVSLKGIHKSYGAKQIIRGVDLEIEDGEFVVFVGPSGCGKTTTLRMVAGLEEITAGDLLIDGVRVNDTPPAQRGAAMVFQSYALYPHMTVAENMGFALKMAGQGRAERDAQVRRAAEILHITDMLNQYPKSLSGGQRQRVAIGRAIVRKPKVFLFDEPLSNLDASLRVSMRIELTRLHKELGTTMIYVTHDQVEAMTMGDRIALFNQGRIAQVGGPMDLYRRPCDEFVAGFIGSPRINMIDRPQADTAGHALWQQAGAHVDTVAHRIGIRPEHLTVVAANEGVAAEVDLAEHLGDASILHLRVAGIADLLRAKVGAGGTAFAQGARVGLRADPASTLAFDANGGLLSGG